MARCATKKGMNKFAVPTSVGLFVPRPLKWKLQTYFRVNNPYGFGVQTFSLPFSFIIRIAFRLFDSEEKNQ
jgi:hypothetical protein